MQEKLSAAPCLFFFQKIVLIVFPCPNVLHLRVPITLSHLVDFAPVSFPVTISVCSSTSRVQALFCYSSWFFIPVLSFDSAFCLDLRFRELCFVFMFFDCA